MSANEFQIDSEMPLLVEMDDIERLMFLLDLANKETTLIEEFAELEHQTRSISAAVASNKRDDHLLGPPSRLSPARAAPVRPSPVRSTLSRPSTLARPATLTRPTASSEPPVRAAAQPKARAPVRPRWQN